MVALKCPSCGGNVQFERGQKTTVCAFCSTQVVTDNSNLNQLDSASRGDVFYELGEYQKAQSLYTQAINEQPDDYRGWLGALEAGIKQQPQGKEQYVKYAKNALKLAPEEDKEKVAARINASVALAHEAAGKILPGFLQQAEQDAKNAAEATPMTSEERIAYNNLVASTFTQSRSKFVQHGWLIALFSPFILGLLLVLPFGGQSPVFALLILLAVPLVLLAIFVLWVVLRAQAKKKAKAVAGETWAKLQADKRMQQVLSASAAPALYRQLVPSARVLVQMGEVSSYPRQGEIAQMAKQLEGYSHYDIPQKEQPKTAHTAFDTLHKHSEPLNIPVGNGAVTKTTTTTTRNGTTTTTTKTTKTTGGAEPQADIGTEEFNAMQKQMQEQLKNMQDMMGDFLKK